MASSTTERLDKLIAVMKGRKSLLIVLQHYPDPDAIASAAGLRALVNKVAGLTCRVVSGGIVGRSENRALLKYLDLSYYPDSKWSDDYSGLIALVDTQPETGNNIVPEGVRPDIVIDHHPIKKATRKAVFHDIRNHYGAASTMIYEYLAAARLSIDQPLATGLLYGIRSDTQDLGRESIKADIDAVVALYPLANKRMLAEINRSKASRKYMASLQQALARARIHGKAIVSNIGDAELADVIAEAADMLLRVDGITWSMCSAIVDEELLFSIRTIDPDGRAGEIARTICQDRGSGGGHHSMAGGRIILRQSSPSSIEKLVRDVRQQFLKKLRQPTRGSPLDSS